MPVSEGYDDLSEKTFDTDSNGIRLQCSRDYNMVKISI